MVESRSETGGAGQAQTIVVVENPALLAVVRRVLTGAGYQVLEAVGPDEALKICEFHDGPVHGLLAGADHEEMSGLELARQAMAKRPGLRVLFVSGYPREVLFGPDGAREFPLVQKPFTHDHLLRTLRESLDSHR